MSYKLRSMRLIMIVMVLMIGLTSSTNASDKGWRLVNIFDMGLGIGTRSDVGIGKNGASFLISLRAVEVAYGIDKLNGFGIGTTVRETMGAHSGGQKEAGYYEVWSSHGLPQSFFPINLYFPLSMKSGTLSAMVPGRGTLKSERLMRTHMLYLEVGGSKWASRSDYIRIGLSYQRTVELIDMSNNGFYTPISWAIRGGFYYKDSYTIPLFDSPIDIDSRVGFYIFASIAWGGVFAM